MVVVGGRWVVTGVLGYEIQLSAHKSAWSAAGYVVVGILVAVLLWSVGRTWWR